MAELFVLCIYIFSSCISSFYMIKHGYYTGELKQFRTWVSDSEIIIIQIITIIGFLLVYVYYRKTKKNKKYLLNKKYLFNMKRLNSFYMSLLIMQLVFVLSTGVGIVGQNNVSKISFVFSFFNVDCLFGIYYFLAREGNNKKFYINIILYSCLKLLQGWTSFIFIIFLYELYYYYKKKKINYLHIVNMIISPVILISFGGFLYKFLYKYKFWIRQSEIINLTYYEAIEKLTERFTFFPISIAAYENYQQISQLYKIDMIFLKEIQGFFRPILPRMLMSNKEFRSLSNNTLQSFWFNLKENTSSSMGMPMYSFTLFRLNIIEFILWIIMIIFLISIMKKAFNSMEQYHGQFDFLYFMMIFDCFYAASLENTFSYKLFPLIYMIPIMRLFKLLKIKRGIL